MREMKDSGVEWIGEIPEHWDVQSVKSAFYRKKSKAQQEDPIVLSLARSGVKVRNIANNEGQLAQSYFDYNPVIPGDLLINPMDLYSGANCNVSEIKGVISPAYVNLRARDGFDPKFYDYYFKTQYWSMALFAHGVGVSFDNRWTLNNETLKNYKIPVPAFSEQVERRIFIDKKVALIDNIIEKTKESIEEYKKYKQALITETVTKGLNPDVKMKDSEIEWIGEIPEHWGIRRLKYMATILNGKDYKHLPNGDIPLYGSGGIFGLVNDYLFEGISVLLGRKGTIDNPLFINGKFWTVDTMFYTKIHDEINPKYFYYQVKTTPFNFYSTSTALPSMTQYDLSNHKYAFCELEEQNQIVKHLDSKTESLNTMINNKEILINELELYKKSLIYEVVTGKKVVN